MKTMVLAIGGNSLIHSGEKGTMDEQLINAHRVAVQIVNLIREGYRMVLTHGNGPQVGAELLLSERAIGVVPGHPLDVCDASTQGEMGYLLQLALHNELKRARLHTPVATVVTQCMVSLDDPAMNNPSKPVGRFYSHSEAEERRRQYGWTMVMDGDRGYRRVVASPHPLEIMEWEAIQLLVRSGILVIACGGGGIPVAWVNGSLAGVEAVIDKDLASSLLASKLRAEMFVIGTDYRQSSQQPLSWIDADQLEKHARAGQFPPGSMGPKVESVIKFLRDGGEEAIIASVDELCAAVSGAAGTHVLPASTNSSQDSSNEVELASRQP
jgi:carbamate kinase